MRHLKTKIAELKTCSYSPHLISAGLRLLVGEHNNLLAVEGSFNYCRIDVGGG